MKTYAAMGYTNLESCLEFVRQEELSAIDRTDYTIDEIDGITFITGPLIDDEYTNEGIVVGGCSPTGDISISMTHCKALVGLANLPLETVVKLCPPS